MKNEICQSCAIPLNKEVMGTNKNGSKSEDYCEKCFLDGEFTDKNITKEDITSKCVEFMVKDGVNRLAAENVLEIVLPTLKRWKPVN